LNVKIETNISEIKKEKRDKRKTKDIISKLLVGVDPYLALRFPKIKIFYKYHSTAKKNKIGKLYEHIRSILYLQKTLKNEKFLYVDEVIKEIGRIELYTTYKYIIRSEKYNDLDI
jgi:hypothetical protein